MILGYPTNDMVLGFQGHRLGLGLMHQQHYCLLTVIVEIRTRDLWRSGRNWTVRRQTNYKSSQVSQVAFNCITSVALAYSE